MKRIAFISVAVIAVLVWATPALAASLGMSPSKVTVQVPADGTSTVDLQAYYYSGDIQVSLDGIPLTVTPDTVHVDAADNPQEVQLTFHGDPSLGSKIYDGYITFTGGTGGMIAIAVKVKAQVTNLVPGQTPVLATPPTTTAAASVSQPEATTSVQPQSAQTQPAQSVAASSPQKSSDFLSSLSLNTVIIIAAGAVFLGLIALAIGLAVRRR